VAHQAAAPRPEGSRRRCVAGAEGHQSHAFCSTASRARSAA
jgi:hypothetical protein